MVKSGFIRHLLAGLSVSVASIALTSSPASAATPTLTRVELTGSIHSAGSANFGGNTAPAMSDARSTDVQPYVYGQYSVIWNLSNPDRKRVNKYIITTYQCTSFADSEALFASPLRCGAPAITSEYAINRAWSAETFVQTLGANRLHKKWTRSRIRIEFSDGTAISNYSNSRYYFNDAPRNELPTASTRGADGVSVPENTAMTMTFNQWSALNEWNAGNPTVIRAVIVYRCTARPTDVGNVFVSFNVSPTGCTRLVRNGLLEPHTNAPVTLNFSSGAKGTFIYALDTLSFNGMPTTNDVVSIQKRAIYTTYSPAELPSGPAAGAGGSPAGDPAVVPTPLQTAGIDTTVAPVVSTSGQATSSGITAVIQSNRRYTRGTQRRVLSVRVQPSNKSQGSIVAALVSTAGGVDKVHLTKKKVVRNGKTTWRWRFPTSLPRGGYTLYVSFTPTDTAISPMTITKRVRLQ